MRKDSAIVPEARNPRFFGFMFYGLIALVAVLLCFAAASTYSNWLILISGIIFLAGVFALYLYLQKKNYTMPWGAYAIAVLLVAGVLLRLVLAVSIYGYKSDVDCFTAWANTAFTQGLNHFYTNGQFADYPPLYIYVLYFLGAVANVFQISASFFLVKLPAIICDCITAFFIYSLARQKLASGPDGTKSLRLEGDDEPLPVLLFACIMLNPAIIMNSAVWGQIDIIYTLMAVLCVYLLIHRKIALAIILFVLALLLKVQSVLVAPVILFAVIDGLRIKATRKNTLVQFLVGTAAALGLGLALVIPFNGGRPITWIFIQYAKSLGVYQFVTVNGFNLYGLFNLNWIPLSDTFLGLPYTFWGILGEAAVFIYSIWLFILYPKGKNLFNILAFIVLGVYMFAQSMHERYSFAAPVLLLFSWCLSRDKRIFFAALFTSGTVLANQCIALQYDGGHWIPYETMGSLSLINLLAFAYTAVVVTKIALQNKNMKKVRKANGNE